MMRRHIFALMTVVAAVLGAVAQDFKAGELYYNVTSDDEVEVARAWVDGASVYKGVVIIPESVFHNGSNYVVTGIAASAFERSGVTEVQIPNTVTTIGESAFAYAESLSSITLPMYLEAVSKTMLAGTAIENIAVPEGVTTIGYGAFQSCPYLRTVFLPSTTKLIDAYGFNNCHSLFEIYCAAPMPPNASGWAIFIGMKGIDVIVADDDAAAAYSKDPVWGDTETFSLWTNEEISITMALQAVPFKESFMKVELGNNLAYRIYDEDGEEMALTAATNYYFAIPDHAATYVVVPTNLINDCEDQFEVTIGTTPVPEVVEDEHPVISVIDGTIYISGDNYGKWTTVYDCYGKLYYQRPAIDNIIPNLPRHRVYIVIVGDYVKKVLV